MAKENRSRDPHFVASYRIGDYPHAGLKCVPWRYANCESVLINAYDFIANHRTRAIAKRILEAGLPIKDHLEFDGPVILDSGAYYFRQSDKIIIEPKEIVELAIKLRVDAVVTLDHPFLPGTPKNVVVERINSTVSNTVGMATELLRRKTDIQLWPVLHGHDESTLSDCFKRLSAIRADYKSVIGLGSLAPLAKTGALRKIVEVIDAAHALVNGTRLHVFSVGSPLLLHFSLLSGAGSVDSQSWIMSAAFKQAQLPGLPQLRLSKQQEDKAGYQLSKERFARTIMSLSKNEGLMLKDWVSGTSLSTHTFADASAYVARLEDQPNENRIHARACHNLHIATFEAGKIVEACKSGNIQELLSSRHLLTPYGMVAKEILQRFPTTSQSY